MVAEKNTSSVVVVRPQPDSEANNVSAARTQLDSEAHSVMVVRQRIENAYNLIAKRTVLWTLGRNIVRY